jgi:ADP-L-glycero-D-manno-heptose 6-epimerase
MILVTGGAGFIGSNLAAALAERGETVVVADEAGAEEKRRNIAKHAVKELVAPADCLAWLARNAGAVRAVFHLGATTDTTARDAEALIANNVEFSISLWDACAAAGLPFFYASSAATYGDGSAGFGDGCDLQALERLRPLNLYGWSKHRLDCHVARAAASGGPTPPRWAGLKFFNVYGPNEYHKGAMQSLIAKNFDRAARGEPTALFRSTHPDFPDGAQRRDFIAVEDCVRVMLWLLDADVPSDIYNVGTGRSRTFAELAGSLYRAVGREPRIDYIEMPEALRAAYQNCTEADLARLRSAGFADDFTGLEEGVERFVERYLSHADRYR